MATFTTLTRKKVNWEAPAAVVAGTPEVDFVFSDATDFLFSNSTDYVFKEATSERADTPWTNLTRKKVTF